MPDAAPPLPLESLQATLRPLGLARGLPAAAYLADDVLAWELAHLFEGGWASAGRAPELAEAGARMAVEVGREPVLLLRAGDGRLRATSDVCRHRGHLLAEPGQPPTSGRAVVCPYHGWAYGLDGSLAGAPSMRGVEEFDPSTCGLPEFPLEEWMGFAMVNVSGDAPSLPGHLGSLLGMLHPWAPTDLVTAARESYVVAANWKVISENYHECDHCSNIHPALCRVSPPDSGANLEPDGAWVGGWMDLAPNAETMSFDGRSDSVPIPGLDERLRRRVLYMQAAPNLLLSMHPDYVLTHRLHPLAPGRTRVECEWLFPAGAFDLPGFDPAYAVKFWDRTNREDWRACESVQRGLAARAYVPGPLSPREDAVHRFLMMVASAYRDGRFGGPGAAP
jgi:glycine betaine catabolism A